MRMGMCPWPSALKVHAAYKAHVDIHFAEGDAAALVKIEVEVLQPVRSRSEIKLASNWPSCKPTVQCKLKPVKNVG
jgi:hypothetical protein